MRVAIHAPPRFGKSIIVSQRFPAWLLGLDPLHRIALAMFNQDRATLFGAVVKRMMLSPEYQAWFPGSAIRKDAATGAFFTAAREGLADGNPSFMALGMLSGTASFGADTWIIDDPYKSREDATSEAINEKVWTWWEDVRVRIAEDANVVLMFHRWQEDDMAGRILASGEFENYRFPAIADANEDSSDPTGRKPGEPLSPMRSLEWLREKEAEDPSTFLSLFQGKPRPDAGAFFKREWFEKGQRPDLRMWVRCWDLAFTAKQSGDWTVGALGSIDEDGRPVYRDVQRFRAEWADAVEIIAATTAKDARLAQKEGWAYHVGFDANAQQKAFLRDFQSMGLGEPIPIWPIKSEGHDKKTHASGLAARGKALGILLCDTDLWDAQAFIAEMCAFQGFDTDTDDQVDAASMVYRLMWKLSAGKQHEQTIKPNSWDFYERLGETLAQDD